MSDLPETVGVLAFNPKANKKILSILKEYFECLPYSGLNTEKLKSFLED